MQSNEGSLTATEIEYAGDVWRVLGVGAELNGKTYVHLASLVRGVNRRNGWHPVQVNYPGLNAGAWGEISELA